MKNLMGLVATNYDVGSFGPLTSDRPIASLPFGGRYRLVDFPLSNMVNSGITTVGIITPYMYRSLMDHVGNGKAWELGRKVGGMFILPGTIYGLKSFHGKLLMRDLQNNKPFFTRAGRDRLVVSGSSRIMNIDYRDVATFHEHAGADITLIYKKNFSTHEAGNPYLSLAEDGRVTGISRTGLGSGNCYLDSFIIDVPLLLSFMTWYDAMSYMDIMDIFAENLKQLKVYAYEFDGYVGAVDDLDSYMQCNMDLLRRDVRNELLHSDRPISTKTQDFPPAKYGRDSQVSNSFIGSGCIIEGRVENSIISRSVHVGKGAVVKNSVIMPNCTIGEQANLNNVICDKRVHVKDFVTLGGTLYAPLAIGKQQLI